MAKHKHTGGTNAQVRKEATRLVNKVISKSDMKAAGSLGQNLRATTKNQIMSDIRSGKIISSTDNLKKK